MVLVFGTQPLLRVFGDAPLFVQFEGKLGFREPSAAAPGWELDGDGRRVLQPLLRPCVGRGGGLQRRLHQRRDPLGRVVKELVRVAHHHPAAAAVQPAATV